MMKLLTTLLLSTFLLLVSLTGISAGGFYLSSIGSLNVEGTSYPQYWYTGSNPVLTGVAPVGATVNVIVDGISGTAIAGSDGTWVYQTAISEGDHTITLSTESSGEYTFTLTIGEAPVGVGGIQAPETPQAGVGFPTIALILLGLSPLFFLPLFKKYA